MKTRILTAAVALPIIIASIVLPAFYRDTVWLFVAIAASGSTIRVKSTEPLSGLREKLATDASITEVIFDAGAYRGSLIVDEPRSADFSKQPLVIRAANGASVLFDARCERELRAIIERRYRDRLELADIADPAVVDEAFTALDELTQVLGLGSVYDFQR